MHVYADIAKRYGDVDPHDQAAIRQFFRHTLLTKPEAVREEIFNELLSRDGEPSPKEDNSLRTGEVPPTSGPSLKMTVKHRTEGIVTSARRRRTKALKIVQRTRGGVVIQHPDGNWYVIKEYKGSKASLKRVSPEVDLGEAFKNATLFKSASS
jgi:hypothetical protein